MNKLPQEQRDRRLQVGAKYYAGEITLKAAAKELEITKGKLKSWLVWHIN
jgi:hypothetical protein